MNFFNYSPSIDKEMIEKKLFAKLSEGKRKDCFELFVPLGIGIEKTLKEVSFKLKMNFSNSLDVNNVYENTVYYVPSLRSPRGYEYSSPCPKKEEFKKLIKLIEENELSHKNSILITFCLRDIGFNENLLKKLDNKFDALTS